MSSVSKNNIYDSADAHFQEVDVSMERRNTTKEESSASGSEKETERPAYISVDPVQPSQHLSAGTRPTDQATETSLGLDLPPPRSSTPAAPTAGDRVQPSSTFSPSPRSRSSHSQKEETLPINKYSNHQNQGTSAVGNYNTFSTELGGAEKDKKMSLPMPESNPSHQPDEPATDSSGLPISFADMGIPKGPQLEEGLTGKARTFSGIPLLEKLYALAMLCAIIVLVIFTIFRLTQVKEDEADFVFGLVLLVNSAFCSFYVLEAVRRERPSELLVLSGATVLMVIYMVVNYIFGYQNGVKLARMIIAIVLGIPLVIIGLKTAYGYYISRSLIFRTVGANSQLQTLLQRLYFFQDLLKFDMELGVSMVILVLTSRLSVDTKDIVILSVGGFLTLFWFLFGYFGTLNARPEDAKEGMAVLIGMAQTMFMKEYKMCLLFFPLGLPEIAYVIYKMYDVSHYIDSKAGLAAATIACAGAALVVRCFVLILGAIVYRGFGNGLKEKL